MLITEYIKQMNKIRCNIITKLKTNSNAEKNIQYYSVSFARMNLEKTLYKLIS